ncbi:MAG: WYL domain-containing protein, partial [Clostridia bacterium]|nr:WYL domain-containing protein [Clostridia bacterium]
MIFSELYSAYYNTVARVLKAAQDHPINKEELRSIIGETAFGESVSVIEPALFGEKWQLIKPDGTTPIKEPPTMPLTLLQKRWLKAIYTDPRVRLFTDDLPDFPGVEPLFTQEDVCVFDKYSDGDPFEDKKYVANFRLILDAIRNKYPLKINVLNRKGDTGYLALMPARLEYSEKDDKFRLIGAGSRYGNVINLGRIVRCRPYNKEFAP